jgi:protein involved in polysaccharide export with SLBB domain
MVVNFRNFFSTSYNRKVKYKVAQLFLSHSQSLPLLLPSWVVQAGARQGVSKNEGGNWKFCISHWPKRLLCCIIYTFFYFSSNAQVTVNKGAIDPQKIPATQMPPAQLYEALKDKNGELGTDRGKADKIQKDSVKEEAPSKQVITTDDTYGMHLFKGGPVAAISQLSTPPLDYPIGVNDQIIVSLWGGAEATFEYTVARDGSIFPTGLGKIYTQGLTFDNARSLIRSRFMTVVPSGTNFTISLGQPRTININVAGEVNVQGPVTVSAFTNAFNIIALAGGPTDMANLREIQIKRNGQIIETLDVYKYLTTGDFGKHIYLENNDFVILTTVEKKVKAEGRFKRPMYYQLKKEEGVKALLKYSGGLLNDAFSSGMKVYRTEFEKQTIKDVNATAITNFTNDNRLNNEDFLLMDGDIVKVQTINPGLINKIEIKGEVAYPGLYEFRKGDRLFDVINRAGGFTESIYLQRAYLFRGAADSTNIKSNKIEINLTEVYKGDKNDRNNIELLANDLIVLFNKNQFADKQYVEIFGEVRNPQKINKYGGMTLQDLIYLSGGLKQTAEYGRVEISSILNLDSAKDAQQPTRTVVKTIKINPSLELDSISAQIVLRPYDQIYVRKNPTFELQQLVKIDGFVLYPGSYPKLSSHERLSSYIVRAGGVKENADLSGAVLFRKKTDFYRDNIIIGKEPQADTTKTINLDSLKAANAEPVSIELYKALKYPNSKHDIILQENDVVYVPEINPFVSVRGAVQSPLKLTFDKEHSKLGYYIDNAGGFGIQPWRRRVYVTYANGKSKRTFNFLFFHFYPKIEEGCTINVPVKEKGADLGNTLLQVALATVPIVTGAIIAKIIR